MAIQIAGTTVIDDSKQIQNIGGNGGIISGTFSVGSGSKTITCSSFRGHVFGYVTLDAGDPNDTGAMLASLGWSSTTGSTTFNKYTILNQNSQSAYIFYSSGSNFSMYAKQFLGGTKTAYYSFWYSGNTVPTITIT